MTARVDYRDQLIFRPENMPSIAKARKKTRRYKRDIDQIHADLRDPRHLERYKETKTTEDLPGLGQWYCIECAKWFADEANFTSHAKGKSHKRRYVDASMLLSFRVFRWLYD